MKYRELTAAIIAMVATETTRPVDNARAPGDPTAAKTLTDYPYVVVSQITDRNHDQQVDPNPGLAYATYQFTVVAKTMPSAEVIADVIRGKVEDTTVALASTDTQVIARRLVSSATDTDGDTFNVHLRYELMVAALVA